MVRRFVADEAVSVWRVAMCPLRGGGVRLVPVGSVCSVLVPSVLVRSMLVHVVCHR